MWQWLCNLTRNTTSQPLYRKTSVISVDFSPYSVHSWTDFRYNSYFVTLFWIKLDGPHIEQWLCQVTQLDSAGLRYNSCFVTLLWAQLDWLHVWQLFCHLTQNTAGLTSALTVALSPYSDHNRTAPRYKNDNLTSLWKQLFCS